MKKILILGSNGYLGKNLTKYFSKLDSYKDLLLLSDLNNKSVFPEYEYFQMDITNKQDLETKLDPVINNISTVFYFLGITGSLNSINYYQKFIEVNEIGFLNFLSFVSKKNKDVKIIFPSTRLLFKGSNDYPLKEEDEKEFKTIYALNKFNCENYLKIYNSLHDLNYLIFRLCLPYGNLVDNEYSYGTVGFFLNTVKSNKDIKIFGDGSQKRSLIHIHDLFKILEKLIFYKNKVNETYNLGGPDSLSIRDIAELIAHKYNKKILYKNWPNDLKSIESGDTIFDSSKAHNITNYKYSNNFNNWLKTL